MAATEFDRLIRETRDALEAGNEAPESLEALLLARLQEEKMVDDGTVLEVVYAWRQYESAPERRQGAPHFPHTVKLIETLLPTAGHQPMLHAQLAAIHGDILHGAGELQEAAAAYGEAVDDLHRLHLEVDVKRIYAMATLGQLLLAQGNRRDAEKLFLDVLSYPWYLVMEAEVQALLRHDYVSAGLGLIECRRGDLAALREIFFVPATQSELLPPLQQAIAEARRAAVPD
jgi:tetratricopeptide (TPR) repeat protein